jgi:hypothetical protein
MDGKEYFEDMIEKYGTGIADCGWFKTPVHLNKYSVTVADNTGNGMLF